MARRPAYLTAPNGARRSRREIVQDHAERRLSLEEGAAEIGCCTLTYRQYLREEGAYIKRTITLPEPGPELLSTH